ncbi:hypothetical protein SLEP1_g44833 [Rubroshorea leprosula]|uniref:Uncharacterized protein n=1 Tax=Rubroshorea leprosula TaxID=152421 RepID=A0AAV5LHY7_9ROSI|nr:hypothetical protein SLEP1_g44833 [Rubroshorea leprosula]
MIEIPPAYKKSFFEAALRSKNAEYFNLEVGGVSQLIPDFRFTPSPTDCEGKLRGRYCPSPCCQSGNTETIQVLLQHYRQLAVEDNTPTLIGRPRKRHIFKLIGGVSVVFGCRSRCQSGNSQSSLGESFDCKTIPEGQSPVDAAIKLHVANAKQKAGANRPNRREWPEGASLDNEGLYPLHVACESGNVKAYQALRSPWPDPTEFLDNNYQNILHVAAKNGRDSVVRCIVKDTNLGPKLLNTEDKDGNTPLHLAAMNGHSLVVGTLVLNRNCN